MLYVGSNLSYKEIVEMDLTGIELAFLNCCETGSGRIYAEGVVGLARAFFKAGVKQVVVYRGALPDTEKTTNFAHDFYKAYLQTRRAEVALAEAQRNAYESDDKTGENIWAQYYVMKRY